MRQIDLDDNGTSVTVVTGDDDADIMISVDADAEGIMVGMTAASSAWRCSRSAPEQLHNDSERAPGCQYPGPSLHRMRARRGASRWSV